MVREQSVTKLHLLFCVSSLKILDKKKDWHEERTKWKTGTPSNPASPAKAGSPMKSKGSGKDSGKKKGGGKGSKDYKKN